jgi:hypothetical protein
VYRVLITEILIELTVAALIIMGAGTEFNALFHMVQTGLLPGRQIPQSIFPINDPAAFTVGNSTLLPQLAVFSGGAPQSPVKSAGFAMIIDFAIFAANNSGLHPDTWGAVFVGIRYVLIGFHFSKPCPIHSGY